MQNAKAANMPKDTVERAIKKATSKDQADYKEIVYEGYGPFGTRITSYNVCYTKLLRTISYVLSYLKLFYVLLII